MLSPMPVMFMENWDFPCEIPWYFHGISADSAEASSILRGKWGTATARRGKP